jgi:serine/threonine-protein kinase
MEALVDAVAYCHQHHVVHCDLKPENLMIDSRNRLKVLDFGLARDPNLTRLTPVGSVLGTPTYLAPERYREPESKPEASVDQYALGVIFYEMLAGHTPFFSRDVGDLGRLHMQGAVPPLIQQRPDLPHSLCTMIHRMLGKSPAERYPDLDSVRPILQTIRDQPVEEEATVDLSSPKE